MAGNTTPDNITYPTGGDKVKDINTQLATMASSVQTALTNRFNGAGVYRTYQTKTLLNAAPGTVIGQHAIVNADATASNNGDYTWSGSVWKQYSSSLLTYNPTWTATVSNPTLGSSILTGQYQLFGNFVNFNIYFKYVTGSNLGSGQYKFSLPVTAKSGSSRYAVSAVIELAGTGYFAGNGFINSGSSVVENISTTLGTGAVLSNSTPNWSNNSVLAISGSYVVA